MTQTIYSAPSKAGAGSVAVRLCESVIVAGWMWNIAYMAVQKPPPASPTKPCQVDIPLIIGEYFFLFGGQLECPGFDP